MCKPAAPAEGSERVTPPNHNGYTGLGVDHRPMTDREKLEEAINFYKLGAFLANGQNPLLPTLLDAAEAHLATLPRPPRKEPRVVYAVYTEDGTFHGAFQDRETARITHLNLYGSHFVVLNGEIELP